MEGAGASTEPGEAQYMEDGGQEKPKFFSQDWIKNVKETRAGKVSKMPMERASIIPLDQRKLMLHLDWEDCDIVLQNEQHLTMGTESSEQQISWQALLTMDWEERQTWIQERSKGRKKGEDVLLVVELKDLHAVRSLQGVLRQMKPEGLGILVPLDSEAQLFPTVSDMVAVWPWKIRRVTRFERPLQWEDGTNRWAVATCSTRASRENVLQPNYPTTRLGEVAEPMYRFKVEVQRRLGLEGAQAQLWPGKVKYVTSVIFKEVSEESVDWRSHEVPRSDGTRV